MKINMNMKIDMETWTRTCRRGDIENKNMEAWTWRHGNREK